MESYRITRWAVLPRSVSGLSARKALTAMSVGWVSRSWLEREARMSPREVDSLLSALDAEGTLERCNEPPVFGSASGGATAAARALVRQVSRRIADAALRHHPWPLGRDHEPTLPMDGA